MDRIQTVTEREKQIPVAGEAEVGVQVVNVVMAVHAGAVDDLVFARLQGEGAHDLAAHGVDGDVLLRLGEDDELACTEADFEMGVG